MFDLGGSELLVIGVVALIVVGPKDLPGLFRTVGNFVGKAKGMAREFSRAMDQAADESGVKDVTAGLKAAANPTQFGLDKVKDAAGSFKDWTPGADGDLDEDRADAAKKIHDASAKKAQARLDAEAAAKAPTPDVTADAQAAEQPPAEDKA
ncbi:Sec-independent protein translocase protein TatB [Thalassovita gelatinovora]|uniref:Sec-independent protein translocase protein TatB n=1 Tax=Thalassovita gelatinovora TaxID=53501 RepID=A0A0P1FG51_THAGE|nr:Sec-independent protein translocase protein TatB [Thalassovita gelatinovora]QIZ79823.1 twin-arginine translocase subunit TatB [Thalassovita gelatinovora]CUH66886.1 Sec-independent protein translocase protein TatB [Thalassovita gelatinovora]SEQ44563.1 sec-independent protein translocase protein TatB [Thalassovita gelatinovora]